MSFNAPVKAMKFLLDHSVDIDDIRAFPQFEDASDDLINDILQGASSFASDVIAPTL